MRVRPARPGDQAALKAFACSDGTPHQSEVEDWLRRNALRWAGKHPTHSLLVMVEEDASANLVPEDETVLGCVAYEPDDEPDTWFIKALAVRRTSQNGGLGTDLLLTVLDDLRSQTPGGTAFWHVEIANFASLKMCERVGADCTSPPGYRTLMLCTVRLTVDDEPS